MYDPSNLRELLETIALNYPTAKQEQFKQHPLANIIRKKPKETISQFLDFDGISIVGSPGLGQWTHFPWIAVINKHQTTGPQDGIYVVYLFSEDLKRLYITLNQGVTIPIELYGTKKAISILRNRAQGIRMCFEVDGFCSDDNISIADHGNGKFYEDGMIFYKEYNPHKLPSEQILEEDLIKITVFYNSYLKEANILTSDTEFIKEYKNNAEEGRRVLTSHYTYERDSKLVNDFKEKCLSERRELRCEACGFSFRETYGVRGDGYIEVHHLKAVSEMGAGKTTNFDDLALVCSNCHRMIHRQMPYLTIDELKRILETG